MRIRLRRRTGALALAVLAVLLGACSGSDDETGAAGGDAARTVEVEMVDIAFKPDRITVAKGQTVRFVFTNRGKVRHEGYVGTAGEQADHEEEMADGNGAGHDGHGRGDDEGRTVTVEPGETGELTYRFAESGTLEVGCHEPGHYATGMKIIVDVA